jgi:effector-binding domain-containing protein
MTIRASVEEVQEQPVAAVRRCVAQPEIATAFRQPLSQVWDFIQRHEGLRHEGHNVFIYRVNDPECPAGKMMTDFGVQVTRAFEGEGEVICTSTPAGRAAITLHIGPYERLIDSYRALECWCAENGHIPSGVSWEVYGEWTEDLTKLETRIFLHLQ